MRVLDALEGGRPRISIEVVPPARGGDLDSIKAAVEAVMPWEPAFVSVTDHAGGRAWVDGAGGPRLVALRTRPGTLGTAVALREAFRVATVPHLVALGMDRLAVEDLLIDLHHAGFHDVFAVRGDDRGEAQNQAEAGGAGGGEGRHKDATELVRHIADLNAGRYTPPAGGKPTSFVVGVAGYPEKHFAAPNLESDLDRLEEKVSAGASFIVTQMVFDAAPYRDFVAALRGRGITVPVIPGIKPLLRSSSLSLIPRTFFVTIPQGLVRALGEARTPAEERAAGLAWAEGLARDLLDAGAPCLHWFTMGRGETMRGLLEGLFGKA